MEDLAHLLALKRMAGGVDPLIPPPDPNPMPAPVQAAGRVGADVLQGIASIPQRAIQNSYNAVTGEPWTVGPAVDAALLATGASSPFAPKGAVGSAGGRVKVKLPMDEASRMARAKSMGFTREVFHGTPNADGIKRLRISRVDDFPLPGVSTTPNPKLANYYAAERAGSSPAVLPLRARGKFMDFMDFADDFERATGKEFSSASERSILAWAKKRGIDGVTHADEIRVFDPRNIRSQYAAFDPAKEGSSMLLAAGARDKRVGAGLVANASLNEAGPGIPMTPPGAVGAAGGKLSMGKGTAKPATGNDARGAALQFLNEAGLPKKGVDKDAYRRVAKGVLDSIKKGEGPLDLSGMAKIPDVPQAAIPRRVPPRGVSPRLQAALADKDVVRGLAGSIDEGIKMGADKWYHTQAIRDAWVRELGPVEGPKAFAQYMDMVAATSPGHKVPENIRTASYYYGLARGGQKPPGKLPYPYGHKAQQLHKQNFAQITKPQPHGLGADAPAGPATRWDFYKNPKPASFSENLQGNLEPGTMDTHAFRNISIRSRDPRFLQSTIAEPYKGNLPPRPGTMAAKYGEVKPGKKGELVTYYRPRKLYDQGRLSLEEAQSIPTFWASKPNANEYAAVEALYKSLGKKRGIPTADAQAAAWAGGGKVTGLGTTPDKTFAEMFNERVLFTAKMRGLDPQEVLRRAIKGSQPLLSLPAAAGVGAAAMREERS